MTTANCILKWKGPWLFLQQIIILFNIQLQTSPQAYFFLYIYKICTFYVFTILYNAGIVSETCLCVSHACMEIVMHLANILVTIWIFIRSNRFPLLCRNACSLNQSKTQQHHTHLFIYDPEPQMHPVHHLNFWCGEGNGHTGFKYIFIIYGVNEHSNALMCMSWILWCCEV